MTHPEVRLRSSAARCAGSTRPCTKPLDGVPGASVRSLSTLGGSVIQHGAGSVYDFDRLERAVDALLEQAQKLEDGNASLRSQIVDRDRKIQSLDGEILELNQRRLDVAKRIDDLVAQLDTLASQPVS